MISDPIIVNLLWCLLIAIPPFMIGYSIAVKNRDKVIEDTINYLIDGGYLKSSVNDTGEIVIEKLDEDNHG